jgi:hypothetical protein
VAGDYPNNNQFSCLPRVRKVDSCINFLQFRELTSSMTSTLGTIDEATKILTEATIHNPLEEEERLQPVQKDKSPRVQKNQSKRTTSNRHKTGRVSTHHVILDPAAQRAQQVSTEPPRRTPPPPPLQAGRFATSSATYPGEGHGGDWCPCEPYGQDAQYDETSWRRDSYNHPAPLHDFRRCESHMPLPYGYQLSSPYRSSLHVPPREPPRNEYEGLQQTSSSSVHFLDFSAFSDAVQREIQRVSPNSYFILTSLPATGENDFWRRNYLCNTNRVLLCSVRIFEKTRTLNELPKNPAPSMSCLEKPTLLMSCV